MILDNPFQKGCCKDSSFNVIIIEKWVEAGRSDRNGVNRSCQPLRKAREHYWMMKLKTMYPYGLNDRYDDEYKTENTHSNMSKNSIISQKT